MKRDDDKAKKKLVETSNMIKCPHCGFEFERKLTCTRCEYTWIPRSDEPPKVCPNPKCKSPYWNVPRKNGKNNKVKK